jgi:hypothetical protein
MTAVHWMFNLIVLRLPLLLLPVPLSHSVKHVTEPVLVHQLILSEISALEVAIYGDLKALPGVPIEVVIIEISFEFVYINQILEGNLSLVKDFIVDIWQFKL